MNRWIDNEIIGNFKTITAGDRGWRRNQVWWNGIKSNGKCVALHPFSVAPKNADIMVRRIKKHLKLENRRK